MKRVLLSMDSEWDQLCLKVVLAAGRSWSETQALGLDPQTASQALEKVASVVDTVENSMMAAKDMVNLRLQKRKETIPKGLKDLEKCIEEKRGVWSDGRLGDQGENLNTLKANLENASKLLQPSTPAERQRFHQAVKRTATSLLEENRVKRRCLGAGAPRVIDTDDEEFVVKCIEEKSAIHGCRHETVAYLDHRVKSRDLLTSANHHRRERGLKEIRSATSVWNRSRPRNKRSRQAKCHTGNGLFCTKKPPKTADSDNENIHHQRAHGQHALRFLFSEDMSHVRPYCFARSKDDKAYVTPGTSEGFARARNVRILTPAAARKARSLPKYDWLEPSMYQTPATHRILHRMGTSVDGKEKIVQMATSTMCSLAPKVRISVTS